MGGRLRLREELYLLELPEAQLSVEAHEFPDLVGLAIRGLGFRIWGLGFRIWGLGFRIWGFRV